MEAMKDKIKGIFKIKFFRDVVSLQISTITIAVITVITSLIIAKGLKPMDFGIYSLVLSIYGIIGMFGNLGIKQTALVKLPSAYINQDREKSLSILAYYFKALLIIGILIMIIGYIIAPYLSQLLYGRQDIGRFSRILFLMPLLVILYKLVVVILEGTGNMMYLAITESASEIIESLILIALVSLGLTILIYGWLFSAIASSLLAIFIYSYSGLVKKGLPSLSEIIKRSHVVSNLHFLKFNLSMGVSENIISLNENLPIILLGIFVLPKDVGYFKLGYSVIGVSILFLKPIARNLLVKLRQLQGIRDTKELSKTFYRVSLYTGIISIILVTVIIILFHFLVYFLLKDYQPSLKIIYILAIYFCLLGFGVGLSPVLRALERLDIEIKANVIGTIILIVLSILLIGNLGILGMTITLLFSALFTKLIMYLSIKNLLKLETL